MLPVEEVMDPMKNITGPANSDGIYLYYTIYILGWISTSAWSLSFYPQVLINWKRKSVVGLSFDFIAFNFVGFLAYSVYVASLLWIPSIQAQNEANHPDNNDSVHVADAVFSFHALFLVLVTLLQCSIYERSDQKVSEWTRVILVVLFISVVVLLIVPATASSRSSWTWLRSINTLSYFKVVVTVLKYWPQVLLNYRRKSTEGWSVHNVILDFVGGWISLIQMFIDAAAPGSESWPSSFQNIVKYWLCVITLVFDTIFLVQHFALYNRKVPAYRPVEQRLDAVLNTPVAKNSSEEGAGEIDLGRGSPVYRENHITSRSVEPLINKYEVAPSGSRYGAIGNNSSQAAEVPEKSSSHHGDATEVKQQAVVNNCIHNPGHPYHQNGVANVQAPDSSRYSPFFYGATAEIIVQMPSSDGRTMEVIQPLTTNNCIHGPGHLCYQANTAIMHGLPDDVSINSPTNLVEGNCVNENSSISNEIDMGNHGISYPPTAVSTPSELRTAQPSDNRESVSYTGLTQEEAERLQREYQDLGIQFSIRMV